MEPNKALRDYTQVANSQRRMITDQPMNQLAFTGLHHPQGLTISGQPSEIGQLKVTIGWRPLQDFK